VPTPTTTDPTPLPTLTVQQLAYLVAAADSTSFSEAAASLGVTTSALSQGLAELERRLGIGLFERAGRRQVLRDEAGEVLTYARRVVADTRDLGRWIAATTAGRTGRLRVGMIDAAAIDHFPDQIRAFRRAAPEVELRLVVAPSGALLEQLARGDLDLAVVVEPSLVSPAIDTEVLLTEPIVVVPPEGIEVRAASSWGPWVLFPTGSQTRSLIERELRARGATSCGRWLGSVWGGRCFQRCRRPGRPLEFASMTRCRSRRDDWSWLVDGAVRRIPPPIASLISCAPDRLPDVPGLHLRSAGPCCREEWTVFLGEDLLPWLVLAIGGALAIGTIIALVRPPKNPETGDLARPPLVRSIVMITLGSVAAIWGLASLLA
jgi:DNA-binding transcriptional LysR family regulator